ncbi:MAG: hypothetical protein HOU81_08600 [Hamadaea sp.]|uniref:hypothetical protein n=1 Tax=Hamadaea sp. TaxID=2024425 RepID=UPI0017B16109|nr:hypothetical protein [Hamadaea sp.]NUR70867.1 hypothetical protein [Hamadaea sp.]NUT20878.1 hypothetical protein [Hamadaea sp.]
MRKLLLSTMTAVALIGGTVLAAQGPALAAAGNCDQSHPYVGACVDYQGGAWVNADFYLNTAPSITYAKYRVGMQINTNPVQWVSGSTLLKLDHTGRYTNPYWHINTDTLPDSSKQVRTLVEIWNSTGTTRTDHSESDKIIVFN